MNISTMVLDADKKEYKQEFVEFDKETGEIYRYPKINSPLMTPYHNYYTTSEYAHTKDTFMSTVPQQCKSRNQLDLYLDTIDKRTVVSANNVKPIMDMSCGAKERGECSVPKISKKQYELLNKIVSSLTWSNFIHATTQEISVILDCPPKHIKRKLESLDGMVRWEAVKHGEWRIFVNPAYAFKNTSDTFQLKRSDKTHSWLFPYYHVPVVPNNEPAASYEYKGKSVYFESMVETMDDFMYQLEFGKSRAEDWAVVENTSSSLLPEHLSIEGSGKKYKMGQLHW